MTGHLIVGLLGGTDDGVEHVQHPGLPCLLFGHTAQQGVVLRLVCHDVARQEKHRDVQQPGLHQIQQVDDPSGTAIAIVEGVDGLELVVHHGHLHQGVEVVLGVDEVLQIAQLVPDDGLAHRLCVDDLPRTVLQCRATGASHTDVLLFDDAHDVHEQVGGQWAILQCRETELQRLAVAKHLLGVGVGPAIGVDVGLVERIVGGDDVFDLGRQSRLLQYDAVDQQDLVGDLRGQPPQVGQYPNWLRWRVSARHGFPALRQGAGAEGRCGEECGCEPWRERMVMYCLEEGRVLSGAGRAGMVSARYERAPRVESIDLWA